MKSLIVLLTGSMLITVTGCGSKKAGPKDDQQPREEATVFGTYYYYRDRENKKGNKATAELKQDSTASLDMNTSVSGPVHLEGTFSIQHDSIFINWSNGRLVKSRFEKQKDQYIFTIGSTRYIKEL